MNERSLSHAREALVVHGKVYYLKNQVKIEYLQDLDRDRVASLTLQKTNQSLPPSKLGAPPCPRYKFTRRSEAPSCNVIVATGPDGAETSLVLNRRLDRFVQFSDLDSMSISNVPAVLSAVITNLPYILVKGLKAEMGWLPPHQNFARLHNGRRSRPRHQLTGHNRDELPSLP